MRLSRRKTRAVILLAAVLTLLLSMRVAAAQKEIKTRIEAKVISSENMPAGIPFTVVLTAVDQAPLPAVTEKTVYKSGTVVFDDIVFTQAGDYYYTLTQETGDEKYVEYDPDGPYTIIVRVVEDPAAPGGLAAAVGGWRGTIDEKPSEVTKPASFNFHNKYDKPTKTVTHTSHKKHKSHSHSSVRTGDSQNPLLWILLAGGSVAAILIVAGLKRRK